MAEKKTQSGEIIFFEVDFKPRNRLRSAILKFIPTNARVSSDLFTTTDKITELPKETMTQEHRKQVKERLPEILSRIKEIDREKEDLITEITILFTS